METITKLEVKEITWPGKTFIGKRAQMSIDKLSSFFGEAYGAVYPALGKQGIQSQEPPFAIYYSVDEAKKETDVAAAVAVPESAKDIEGFERINIPRSKALLVSYYGPYENMRLAYDKLDEYAAKHNLKKAWVLEQYFSDPQVEKDPAKWKTDIYFIVK